MLFHDKNLFVTIVFCIAEKNYNFLLDIEYYNSTFRMLGKTPVEGLLPRQVDIKTGFSNISSLNSVVFTN